MAKASAKRAAAKAPVKDVWQPFLAGLGVKVLWIDDAATAESVAKEFAQAARDGIPVVLDFETSGGLAHGATTPRLVQLYAGADEVAVIDLAATGFEVIGCLADVGCIAYGATFEARIFLDQGFEPVLHDAAIAAGCRRDRDVFLKDLTTTWRRLFRQPVPTTKRTMQLSDFFGELTPEQVAYAATDAVLTLQIWRKCTVEVQTKSYKVAQGAIRATVGMEMAGMPYDKSAHDAIIEEWLRVAKREVEAFVIMTGLKPGKNAGGAVPIASGHAVKAYLTEMVPDELKETWPRTEAGGWTLSGKELKGLPQADLPAVAQYLRATALAALLNTFGTKLRERASPYTGRIHFGFWLAGAISGRMTSSPNGQNMPGGPFRRIFRAPAGWRLISIDYAAVELRAAALLSHEDSLLDVFRHPSKLPDGSRSPDGDPHEALTRALSLDPRINSGHRLAKALNFRLLYLTGPRGFAKQSGLSVEESGKLMDRWRLVRPKLARWQRGMKRLVERQKFTSTPLGRTVNCVIIDGKTGQRQVSAPRGVNIPIQGGCAEAIMIALRLAHERLQSSGSPARLLAAVHDEIVLEAPQEAAEEAAVIVSGAMQDAFREVFGSYPRYDDAARFVVGKAKIGETWDGPPFDLDALDEEERVQLVKGLDDLVVDQDGEEIEEQEVEEQVEEATEQVESTETTEQEVEGPLPWEDDPAVDRDHLLEKITERTLKLLRQVNPRQLRLAFRQAGVELLHKADVAKLADLARRLSEPLPIDETPEHCRLGPSSAARWLNCPGSVIAIEEAPSYSSVHAHEGHKAHMALEWCLRLDVVPSQIVDPGNWPDVARSVEVALEYIRRQVGELHVEVRFMIDDEVGLGGTADTVAVNDQEIVVVDFKHGKTAIVVRDNAQLQTYAIGARQRFGERKRYRLVIIQPRAGRPTDVTEWTVTDADLRHFERQLLTAAKATMQVDVVRRAGAWCQWCPARSTCDEYRARQGAEGDAAVGHVRLQSHGSDAVWNVGASTAGEPAHADMGPKIGEGALPGLSTLPNAGSYGVIVADPPWRFDVRNRDTGLRRSPDQHYSTMTLADIKALPVGQIAGPDCWLLLWTTGPHLPQAFEVMEAWGFRYSSLGFVWVKLRRGYRQDRLGILPSDIAMGLGYTTRKASEPCLLGRRGNPRRLRNDVRDVIIAPVREHSRKPDEFYERVEQFAAGPRLELFAREHRRGWDGWGNELDKFQGAVRHTLPSAVAPGGVDPELR